MFTRLSQQPVLLAIKLVPLSLILCVWCCLQHSASQLHYWKYDSKIRGVVGADDRQLSVLHNHLVLCPKRNIWYSKTTNPNHTLPHTTGTEGLTLVRTKRSRQLVIVGSHLLYGAFSLHRCLLCAWMKPEKEHEGGWGIMKWKNALWWWMKSLCISC